MQYFGDFSITQDIYTLSSPAATGEVFATQMKQGGQFPSLGIYMKVSVYLFFF
jgi:hypothetical protein